MTRTTTSSNPKGTKITTKPIPPNKRPLGQHLDLSHSGHYHNHLLHFPHTHFPPNKQNNNNCTTSTPFTTHIIPAFKSQRLSLHSTLKSDQNIPLPRLFHSPNQHYSYQLSMSIISTNAIQKYNTNTIQVISIRILNQINHKSNPQIKSAREPIGTINQHPSNQHSVCGSSPNQHPPPYTPLTPIIIIHSAVSFI